MSIVCSKSANKKIYMNLNFPVNLPVFAQSLVPTYNFFVSLLSSRFFVSVGAMLNMQSMAAYYNI